MRMRAKHKEERNTLELKTSTTCTKWTLLRQQYPGERPLTRLTCDVLVAPAALFVLVEPNA